MKVTECRGPWGRELARLVLRPWWRYWWEERWYIKVLLLILLPGFVMELVPIGLGFLLSAWLDRTVSDPRFK